MRDFAHRALCLQIASLRQVPRAYPGIWYARHPGMPNNYSQRWAVHEQSPISYYPAGPKDPEKGAAVLSSTCLMRRVGGPDFQGRCEVVRSLYTQDQGTHGTQEFPIGFCVQGCA